MAILKPQEGGGGAGEGGDSEARKMAEMWRARNSLSGSEGAGSSGGAGGQADDQGKEPSLSVSFLSGSQVSDTDILSISFADVYF